MSEHPIGTAEPTDQPVSVFVIAPPTTNGPLHVGHLSGPYVASDIVSRAARLRGERVLTIGGVDVHPNWVLTRAENDGIEVDKLIWDYRQRIDEALARARIECDVYLDPQQAAHQQAVAELADHLAENRLRVPRPHPARLRRLRTDPAQLLPDRYLLALRQRFQRRHLRGLRRLRLGPGPDRSPLQPVRRRADPVHRAGAGAGAGAVPPAARADLDAGRTAAPDPRPDRRLPGRRAAGDPARLPDQLGGRGRRLDGRPAAGRQRRARPEHLSLRQPGHRPERATASPPSRPPGSRSTRSGTSTASTTASTSRCCGRRCTPRSASGPTRSAAPWSTSSTRWTARSSPPAATMPSGPTSCSAARTRRSSGSTWPGIVRTGTRATSRWRPSSTSATGSPRCWPAATGCEPQPAELVDAELARGLNALRPGGYDSALAARCLLANAGSAADPRWQQLRAAIAGTGRRAASGRRRQASAVAAEAAGSKPSCGSV